MRIRDSLNQFRSHQKLDDCTVDADGLVQLAIYCYFDSADWRTGVGYLSYYFGGCYCCYLEVEMVQNLRHLLELELLLLLH